jgi:N6-L-threonylcarbamoyladenine synthase
VLANTVASQIVTHQRFGGVMPEVAAREHLETINAVVAHTLEAAHLTLAEVDAIAATLGPGLIGALLVGANTAKTLAFIANKPFIGVHHLHGHVASNYLESDLTPPFLCLLASGGHTQLLAVHDYQQVECLGSTLDDALGEAFDKVARMMDLPYPGGPHLDALAQRGNPTAFNLPIARTQRPWDFSFSGLKTACMRLYQQKSQELQLSQLSDSHLEKLKADLCASFQATVAKTVVKKTLACAKAHGFNTISVAGGVSANSAIRLAFETWQSQSPNVRKLYLPALQFCTDNAAMIASSAYYSPWCQRMEDDVFSRMALS